MAEVVSAKFDRKIEVQRFISGHSLSGEPIEDWSSIAVRRAAVQAISGAERFGGEQWIAKEQVEFHIRWDLITATISPLDRVIYPVGEPVPANTFDVMAVLPIGRNDMLRIMAARRAE